MGFNVAGTRRVMDIEVGGPYIIIITELTIL